MDWIDTDQKLQEQQTTNLRIAFLEQELRELKEENERLRIESEWGTSKTVDWGTSETIDWRDTDLNADGKFDLRRLLSDEDREKLEVGKSSDESDSESEDEE